MNEVFNLLKTRSINDKLDETEIKNIEKNCSLKLPPIYRLFIETFSIGDGELNVEKSIEGDGLSYYIYKPLDFIGFEVFLSLETAQNVFLDSNIGTYERENSFFPVGGGLTTSLLYVGCAENNKDQIYYEYESDWTFVCNNIFEFVRGLEVWTQEDDPDIKNPIPFSKLYRNWGEDFWRIKE